MAPKSSADEAPAIASHCEVSPARSSEGPSRGGAEPVVRPNSGPLALAHRPVAAQHWGGMSATLASHGRPVSLVRRLPVATAFAVAVLEAAPKRILGSRLGPVWTGPELNPSLSERVLGGAPVTREVRMGVGPLIEDDDALVLPVWWEDAEHPRLFPTFDGGIELRSDGDDATEVSLVGGYEPPLGAVGRFADGLAGHKVVVASLEALLGDIVERLEAGATDRWLRGH